MAGEATEMEQGPEPADRLAEWSRRFLTQVHQDPDLHRAGLLIGVPAQPGESPSGPEEAETRFWPFPELGSLEGLVEYLAEEVGKAQELKPEAVALILPLDPSAEFGLSGQRDYDLLVVAVDAYHHCASLVSAVVVEAGEPKAQGWQDLIGYVPSLAQFLFAAFPELHTPRPSEDMEWALVEAGQWRDAELPGLAVASACELAFRRGGEPTRELRGALAGRPQGEGWQAIVEEAELLQRRYAGYLREVAPDAASSLARLTEPQLSQLFFAALVELARRGLWDELRLEQNAPVGSDWVEVKRRLSSFGERPEAEAHGRAPEPDAAEDRSRS